MANERVDIRLTEGDDLYVWDKTSWAFIYTLGGNDTVKASNGADIDLGPGNDTLINPVQGPRISIHLDLPIKYQGIVKNVVIVKHEDIKRMKEF